MSKTRFWRKRDFWRKISLGLLSILLLALILAWISNDFRFDASFEVARVISFLSVIIIGAGILWLGWWIIDKEPKPSWLAWLLIGAVFLRLTLGVLWTLVLPVYGYNSPVEKAGYVLKDAYARDTAAWDLAKSNKPLWKIFTMTNSSDQYGGLLFFSSFIYRFLGGSVHQPLLIVVLAACCSSLVVIFTWGFVRRIFKLRAANVAAIALAFYPEAVLLGSSQMREAFTMTFVALAFYGLVYYYQQYLRTGLMWTLSALLLTWLFSPPFAAMLLISLVLIALFLDADAKREKRLLRRKEVWITLAVLSVLMILGIWLGWSNIVPKGIHNIVELVNWWLRKVAVYQTDLSKQVSGWLQREFKRVPSELFMPLVIIYGILRPFLPATLVAYSQPVWYGLSIIRAIGWSIMLLSLIYATLKLIFNRNRRIKRGLLLMICAIVWVSILIASIRGGGDQWDNPRYRMIFISLQMTLAAWVWSGQKRLVSSDLRRVLIAACFFFVWFIPWYVRRYYDFQWQVISIFHTIGLGLASAVLYLIWDKARSKKERP